MNTQQDHVNRRVALGIIAAGAGASLADKSAAASIFDLSDPKTRLESYIRLRSRIDGKKTFVAYRGTIFGKPEGRAAHALFDVEGCSWSQSVKLAPLLYRIDTAEAGYFVEPLTREPLDQWVNPLNGLTTTVKHYNSSAHVVASPEDLQLAPITPLPPGATIKASMGVPTLMDETVWMHEDLIATFPSRPKSDFADPLEYFGPTLTSTSLATWSAEAQELSNQSLPFVKARLSYQTLGSWRPFMRMSDTPGLISWRMFGVKIDSFDAVPLKLRNRVLQANPQFADAS
jgi:hypothetical protein